MLLMHLVQKFARGKLVLSVHRVWVVALAFDCLPVAGDIVFIGIAAVSNDVCLALWRHALRK